MTGTAPTEQGGGRSACSVEGCTAPVRVLSRGLCATHYKRWQRHGDADAMFKTPPGAPRAFIEDRLPLLTPEECALEWPFGRTKGRPALWVRELGRRVGAVHLAYFLLHGGWAKQLNHTCNVGACWNPHHVYEGTPRQNMSDMLDAGTARLQNVVTPATALRVLRLRKQSRSQQSIADEVGVSQIVVSRILRGAHWTTRVD